MLLKRRHLVLMVIVSLTLAFPIPGLAQREGKIIIRPLITTSWQVDSNFYKAETFEREVYTYLVQPGINLGYQTAKSMILLNYTLDAHYYDDRDAVPAGQTAADENDLVGHTLGLAATTRPFDRLTLGLQGSYLKTRDPGASDIFSNETDRDKYFMSTVTPRILYEFENRFSIGLSYKNTKTDYTKPDREDNTEHRGTGDLIYNLSRTALLDLEYQHWKREYSLETTPTLATSDYTSDQVKLIFRKQFKYFSIEAGGGYHERDFDDPTLEDLDVFTYRVAFMGQNPPAPEEPRSHILFSAEQNFNDSGAGDNYYKSHRFTLRAGYTFLEKIMVNAGGYYQISPYERTTGLTPAGTTEFRDDDTLNISGSVGYRFLDWLTFSLQGGYEERNSNIAGYDYDNRFFMAKLEARYDLGSR